MPHVMEIVKLWAEPSREKEFLATRGDAISALSEVFPGLIRVQLGRIEGNLWVAVAIWESSGVVSMEHATVGDTVVV